MLHGEHCALRVRRRVHHGAQQQCAVVGAGASHRAPGQAVPLRPLRPPPMLHHASWEWVGSWGRPGRPLKRCAGQRSKALLGSTLLHAPCAPAGPSALLISLCPSNYVY